MKSANFPQRRLVPVRRIAALFLVAAFSVFSVSRADEDSEREQLSRISYELTQLQRMINDASNSAEKKGRARFRYDLLSRDVQLIQSGIDDHLRVPPQPRRVQPLAGDYRN